MSVRTGDRSEGKITAVDASRLLIDYTYDRVHDLSFYNGGSFSPIKAESA